MKHIVKVLSVDKATHDVLIIKAEKPEGISYQPCAGGGFFYQ